jgi:RHS repeat-associated protein
MFADKPWADAHGYSGSVPLGQRGSIRQALLVGRRVKRTLENYTFTVYGYDAAGQMTNLWHYKAVSGVTNTISQLSYTYDVYGEPTLRNNVGTVITTSQFGNRFLFQGRDRDPDTGLYNFRHRYYSPTLGRFLQTDPISIAGGLNLYKFVENNPLKTTDPLGLRGNPIPTFSCKEKCIDYWNNWEWDGLLVGNIMRLGGAVGGVGAATRFTKAIPLMVLGGAFWLWDKMWDDFNNDIIARATAGRATCAALPPCCTE